MNRTAMLFLTCALFILLSIRAGAQIKVGDNPDVIKSASLMELESTNKGFVFPRVSLSSTVTSPAPLATDILAGTVIYNTNAAFMGGIGLFIWTGSAWMAVTPSSLNSTDAWKLTGNSGTNPSINFLGTLDNQPLIFKINNQIAGRLDNTLFNASFGYQSLNANTGGTNNTAIGNASLTTNTTGNNNTALGAGADVTANNLTNATAVGANASVAVSNALVLGNNANVGIGTSSPANKLDVAGIGSFTSGGPGLRMQGIGTGSHTYMEFYPDGAGSARSAWLGYGSNGTPNFSFTNQIATGDMTFFTGRDLYLAPGTASVVLKGASGYFGIGNSSPTANLDVNGTVRFETLPNGVLTTDASGNLGTTTLSAINGSNWSLTGNSGTNPSINFIGTTDAQPLVFKVNNQLSGKLDFTLQNTSFGVGSLSQNTTGSYNEANGFNALASNTTGSYNVANGYYALSSNTTSGYNTANGFFALSSNTTGSNNTAIGSASMRFNTTGTYNEANGFNVMFSNTTGSYNVANGTQAFINNTTGSNNTANGANALLSNTTGNYNTATGYNADVTTGNLTNATAIGYNAKVAVSNALVLGDSTDNVLVGIGTGSPTANLHVKGTVRFAGLPNGVLTTDASGNLSTTTLSAINGSNWSLTGNSGTNPSINFIGTIDAQPLVFKVNNQLSGKLDFTLQNTSFGYLSLNPSVSGNLNTAFGYQSMSSTTTGTKNTANGYAALLYNTTGSQNIAVGLEALVNNTSGNNNTATGSNSLLFNTIGNNNTANGLNSLYYNTTGSSNIASGANALGYNTTGSNNIAMGTNSLNGNITGSNNMATGYNADVTTGNLTNATAIGYNAKVAISNALVLGDSTDNVQVGIGTGSPTANLHVKGTVRFAGLTNGVLTTDASGNLGTTTLSAINGSNWSLTGNSGTNPSTNFIGTIDAQPLVFKVNGQKAGRIDYASSVINTSFGYKALNVVTTGAGNTAIGYSSLLSNTTGGYNTVNGAYALLSNTTGNNNTATGFQSISANTTGIDNEANGFNALASNTTGSYNVANGSQALYSNATGSYNTATGYQSIRNNTTGADNEANGFNALASNTTGTDNTANGAYALLSNTTGNNNTATGFQSISANTTGIDNEANGFNAMASNTTGSYNVANGSQALYSNTTGSYNTATGYQSIRNNTTGTDNEANGFNAMANNTTGSYNVANGSQALYSNMTGSNNTATGYQSIRANTTGTENEANGFDALVSNTTGSYNVANGSQALYYNTTGKSNTGIGYYTLINNTSGTLNTALGYAANVSSDNLTNASAIGANATVSVSNALVLGNNANVGIGTSSPAYTLDVNGNIRCNTLTQTSDRRFKQNIQPLVNALDSLQMLQPVNYTWNKLGIEHGGIAGQQQIGLIAQEVEKIYPELVTTDAQGYKAVNYTQLTPVLIQAVKEQQKEIDSLKTNNNNDAIQQLSKQNYELKTENTSMQQDIETLKAQVKMLMDKTDIPQKQAKFVKLLLPTYNHS